MAEVAALIKSLKKGEKNALSRVLTVVENGGPQADECLALLTEKPSAYIIGITGAPGVGKSTLVNQLASSLSATGKRVAVLAVDPSSPLTGGAILGDRIRMADAASRENIFIRSMASRGALGGLAPQTSKLVHVLASAGFDYVVIETVGVGQSEIEIARTAKTVLLVLAPGMGDGVQALKAGIIEIADIFVINKADYDGVDRLRKELRAMLSLADDHSLMPEIIETVGTEGRGIDKLIEAIQAHQKNVSEGKIAKKTLIF